MSPKAPTPTRTRQKSPNVLRSRRNGQWKVSADHRGGAADVIDGEAVVLGVDGLSDFNGLHSRKHDDEVQFYAFDMLVSDGEDLRRLPLSIRKTNLARLLARRVDGIFLRRSSRARSARTCSATPA